MMRVNGHFTPLVWRAICEASMVLLQYTGERFDSAEQNLDTCRKLNAINRPFMECREPIALSDARSAEDEGGEAVMTVICNCGKIYRLRFFDIDFVESGNSLLAWNAFSVEVIS